MQTILSFANDHRFLTAMILSVFGGIPVTWLWTEFLHRLLKRTETDIRRQWVGITFGILERTLLTTFVLWLPIGAGAFAGAWIIVKAVTGWGGLDQKLEPARARYAVVLMGTIVSIIWAIGWGIWGMPESK
ncbi:MAG: hypothetical protein WCG92_21700 [Hyphomicrobiales bacterium]|nr:hypothetical protein [Alphaproteobacteria bacterium]